MDWSLGDYAGFSATVFLGVVAVGAILCVLPDLLCGRKKERDRDRHP